MHEEDSWHLALDSDRFKILCRFLNQTNPSTDATLHYDMMSGGYRFSDESPSESVADFDIALILPLTTLLRYLRAYRLSVVRGTPRAEFAKWWDSAKILAPNWCGFLPERCPENGIEFVEFCDAKQKECLESFDALEKEFPSVDSQESTST